MLRLRAVITTWGSDWYAGSGAPISAVELAARIDAAALEMAPFPHIYLEEAFSPASYSTLLDHLPETRRYRELRDRDVPADGRRDRHTLYLFPEQIAWLPTAQRVLWMAVSSALRSRIVHDAFKRKFQRSLEERFGRGIDRLRFYAVPTLLRDRAGYRIGIHGDPLSKAITAQFYLPRDARQAHLGTLLHEGREGEAAKRTKTLQFRPASGHAYPVAHQPSWHSVASLPDGDCERDSLVLTYYVQGGVRWALPRLKRAWTSVAYGLRP